MSTDADCVLVVDDEPMVREVLAQYLANDGFTVLEAGDGEEAIALITEHNPDMVLLDLMLPKRNGLEVLSFIRTTSQLPVILLTARGEERDRVRGLEAGADDYVVKPFSAREVAARVRTVLRRAGTGGPESRDILTSFGDIEVDAAKRTVTKNGELIDVPRKEFELLTCFLAHAGTALTREDLLDKVWSSSPEWQDPSTVTVHVRRLRGRLEDDPSDPKHLVTVFGVGYRFDP
ncbi:MAG: response regulator transcription factor [Acidimicrobiales bacterium]|nr:response regulator transcription factor [Acidimicrobiales bacterium]RZV46586.1 MAG: response regulator transcription factor [Acidimicrobiales bacterium]